MSDPENTSQSIFKRLLFILPAFVVINLQGLWLSDNQLAILIGLSVFNIAFLIVAIRYLTLLRKREQERQDNYDQLLPKMNEIQQNMLLAKEDADKANEHKSDFLAIMSHEIRTPMNGLLGTIDLLNDTPLNADQQKYVQIARDSGKSMKTLLNDIMDFSKLEDGKIELEVTPFNLRQLVHYIENISQPLVDQKNLALNISIDPGLPDYFQGDENRLRQVLMNLMTNAIKFTEEGHVDLSVFIASSDNTQGHLTFMVSDTGIGISEEDQKNVFQKFSQFSDNQINKAGGSGLGLSIARNIVELMGGEISFNSQPGQGSCFIVSCPLEACYGPIKEEDHTPKNTVPIDGAGYHILIVDDSETNRIIAREMLNKSQFKITEAENGADAIEQTKHNHFDLILMDISMPGMDGIEAMQAIRALGEEQRHLPIIALTAFAHHMSRQDFIDLGMDDFIAKPVRRNILNDVIAKHLDLNLANEQDTQIEKSDTSPEKLDMEALNNLAADVGEETRGMLLKTYLQEASGRLQTLSQLIPEQKFADIEVESHALKSASYNFGLTELGNYMRDMESAAINKNLTVIEALIPDAEKSFAEGEKLLRERFVP